MYRSTYSITPHECAWVYSGVRGDGIGIRFGTLVVPCCGGVQDLGITGLWFMAYSAWFRVESLGFRA